MNLILLSGGSGKRLWPLSNEIRSKQFIKIFKKEDDSYESMLQRIYRQIRSVDAETTVTVATSKSQVSSIRNQLGDSVGISIEPYRKDTFPAIALATAYLHNIKKIDIDEAVAVCPVDPYVDIDYFETIKKLLDLAKISDTNLTLMGIYPTYPSDKYGYIMPVSNDEISEVSSFKEKPDKSTAQMYINEGALWNGGVFAYKIGYVLNIARELLGTDDYYELYSNYEKFPKISFDYAVVEKEKKIKVVRFSGKWEDLGTWDSLTKVMHEYSIGEKIYNVSCSDTHIINELNIPILGIGLEKSVIVASQDGILVSSKEASKDIKEYVDEMEQEIRFAEKSWGAYEVLDVSDKSMTIKISINANQHMSYHSHSMRDEIWTIISGTGKTIVDNMTQLIKPGDVITIQAGCRHTIIADQQGLKLIEVQLGKEISAHDKEKYQLEM